eukprot:769611-Rhodomonas_salina.2
MVRSWEGTPPGAELAYAAPTWTRPCLPNARVDQRRVYEPVRMTTRSDDIKRMCQMARWQGGFVSDLTTWSTGKPGTMWPGKRRISSRVSHGSTLCVGKTCHLCARNWGSSALNTHGSTHKKRGQDHHRIHFGRIRRPVSGSTTHCALPSTRSGVCSAPPRTQRPTPTRRWTTKPEINLDLKRSSTSPSPSPSPSTRTRQRPDQSLIAQRRSMMQQRRVGATPSASSMSLEDRGAT